MAVWRESDCANCKKRICKTKTRIQNRRLAQSSLWLKDALRNRVKWAANKYVCHKCYRSLNIQKSLSDIEPFLETTPFIAQTETVEEVPEDQCDFSFDQLSDRRCYVLTGIYPDQLKE